jgi:molecular chaperone GrpE
MSDLEKTANNLEKIESNNSNLDQTSEENLLVTEEIEKQISTKEFNLENLDKTENNQDLQKKEAQNSDFIDEIKNIEQIGELKSDFQKLENKMEQLLVAFESKIKYDQHKETIIDRLHKELQQYKSDFYKKLLQPVIFDLIFFTDQLDKNIPFLKDKSAEEIFKYLSEIPSEIRDILYRQGVESYQTESDVFNPIQQKIAKTEPTNDPTLDKKISQHKTHGYLWEGKIIKAEGVNVFVFKE